MVIDRTFPSLPKPIRPTVDAYWSAFLGCDPALLRSAQPCTVRTENSPGLLALQTERDWLFALHPTVTFAPTRLTDLLRLDPAAGKAVWQDPLQQQFMDLYGPAYLLYCPRVLHQAGPPIVQLDARHQDVVYQFQQSMGPVVWQLEQPHHWPRIGGIFQDQRLVAAGAVRCWGDIIAEIFVDTLPAYRNRGYAKALASELTDWVLRETPWLPQYDAEVDNLPSLRVARAVGYAYYGMLLLGTRIAPPVAEPIL